MCRAASNHGVVGRLFVPIVTTFVPVSRFEIERLDLVMTSLLTNQPVPYGSERARD